MIKRTRNKRAGYELCLAEIKVPENLQTTYRNELFYYDDSDATDKNRVILFTTKANLKMLDGMVNNLGETEL